jgi:hypothetical protein
VATLVAGLGLWGATPAAAAAELDVREIRWDRPTPTTLGLQVLIGGDDDYDASISVRYRAAGSTAWLPALPLHRVRPETVFREPRNPAPQFAGSIFFLRPSTTYEVELQSDDPDTGRTTHPPVTATTTAVPGSPTTVRPVTPQTLRSELTEVEPGTVLLLAPGQYDGPFVVTRSGTAGQPIVLRGQARDTTTIVGVAGSPVLDVRASHVHIENLTIRTGQRGIRFLAGTDGGVVRPRVGSVVRGVRILDTDYGITAMAANTAPADDFTGSFICNNLLEGRIPVDRYYDDGGPGSGLANSHGVQVGGGSVVCHNTLSGYGDAIDVAGVNTRAVDIYGNDVRWAFDNGVETDGSEGNVRVFGNRFLNAYSPLSFQPVYGGPVYAFRNVVVNALGEVLKFHGAGGTLTNANGVLVYHNTFVRPDVPLMVSTSTRSANFALLNNLFVGGDDAARAVTWVAPFDHARFDHNGYHPNKPFKLANVNYTDLADLQVRGGQETHGFIAPRDVLATLRPWPNFATKAPPTVDARLAAASAARNRGDALPNLNEVPDGSPDVGALEDGCPVPPYGVRADGGTAPTTCTGDNAVTWTEQHNVQATGATLRKSAGAANSQDAGAVSAQRIGAYEPFNGVEFGWPQSTTTSGCVGLDTANPGTSCSEIPYRLVLQPYNGGALATAYEGGTWVGDTAFAPSDRLRIATVNGKVEFARNGNVFARSAGAPPAQQQVDTSLWDPGATVADARLVRVGGAAPPLGSEFDDYEFVATTNPPGTQARLNGSVVAVFTTNAHTVRFTALPPRTFSEPQNTDRSVVVSARIRRLASAVPWNPQMVNEASFRTWFLAAVHDTGPDLLDLAMRYLIGVPANPPVDQIEGDAHYGPVVDGVIREGADYNDYLQRTIPYPDGVDDPEALEARSLDCSGYVRMVYGFRMGWPLKRTNSSAEPALGLPRRAVHMAAAPIGVEIITRTGDSHPGAAALARLAPGDLVFFDAAEDDGEDIDHVGIYLGLDQPAGDGEPAYHRFLSSRKSPDGPTLGDYRGWSVLDRPGSLYSESFRSARRI